MSIMHMRMMSRVSELPRHADQCRRRLRHDQLLVGNEQSESSQWSEGRVIINP